MRALRNNNSIVFVMSGVAQKQAARKVEPVHMEFKWGEAWGMLQK